MLNLKILRSEIRMPIMKLPVITPVVKLKNAVVMISPGSQLTPSQIKEAGDNVTDLVAPNLLHSAGIPQASSVFPTAKVWGVAGLPEHRPKFPWTDLLNEDNWPYKEELDVICLDGMPKLREALFFHKESKTLLVTDLAFNLLNSQGLGSWILTHAFGTYRKFAISRLTLGMVKNMPAFEKSLQRVLQWDFENIVVAHGEVTTGQGRKIFSAAMAERGIKTL